MYQQLLGKVYTTPGVRELCESRRCWWAADLIASYLIAEPSIAARVDAGDLPLTTFWRFERAGDGCVAKCVTDSTPEALAAPVVTQEIEWTSYDFEAHGDPLVIWSGRTAESETGPLVWVLLTPDEY